MKFRFASQQNISTQVGILGQGPLTESHCRSKIKGQGSKITDRRPPTKEYADEKGREARPRLVVHVLVEVRTEMGVLLSSKFVTEL